MRPLLFLDVDGVLALPGTANAPAGYRRHDVVSGAGRHHAIWLAPQHGAWLMELSDSYRVVWATGWEEDAPRLLGPILGVPEFPVVRFSQRPQLGQRLAKLVDVARLSAKTPLAWLDDDFERDVLSWAQNRAEPTLLVSPDPSLGLTEREILELREFAARFA